MIVGVALAGGQSRRMGRDKALLPLPEALGGGDMVTWTAHRLSQVCDEVLMADGGRSRVAGYLSVHDGVGKGPAAGILGAAAARPGRSLLVLACDLPLVPVSLLRRLAAGDGSADWIVPAASGDRLEPLCALYGPAALRCLENRVRAGRFALHGLAREADLAIDRLDAARWRQESDVEIFTNINAPEDFKKLAAVRQKLLAAGSDQPVESVEQRSNE